MPDRPHLPRLDALIRWAAARFTSSPTPVIDARVLAKAAFALDDSGLIVESGTVVDAGALARFLVMVERRERDEPVAHITGRREFWSLDIEVAPGILTPRTDSETLIEAAIQRRAATAPLRILDLGCGSGALICALLSAYPAAEGLAVDLNPDAAALTARNIHRLGFSRRARAHCGDWFDGIAGDFDLIISNPPYIRTVDLETLPREVRDFESPLALFAGMDGLGAFRAILERAPPFLAEGGLMILEFGEGQAAAVNKLATNAFPAARIAVESDLSGRPRALVIDLAVAAN